MEQLVDHYIGSEVFDLNLKKKISYAKTIPYEYAIISPPYVDESTYEKVLEYEKIFNDTSIIKYLKTWYTENEEEIFGYSIFLNRGIPYSECEILGNFYETPENPLLTTLHKNNSEILVGANYFEKGGKGKYIEFAVKNWQLLELEYFSSLEKYSEIKSAIAEKNINNFLPLYLIDLENEQNFGMNIDTSFMPIDNDDHHIFLKRDASYYLDLKKQYYQNFVDLGILTQDQYDYIFEVSPGAEKTILKFRWEGTKLSHIELESFCVFEFHKVWTRS
jgi:hypothetical protein